MNSNISLTHSNKNICYAVDCKNEATNHLTLDVGKFGLITISVCKNCLTKFSRKQEMRKSGKLY